MVDLKLKFFLGSDSVRLAFAPESGDKQRREFRRTDAFHAWKSVKAPKLPENVG